MTRRRIHETWFGKILTVAALAMAGSLATGCAIHSQAPIKEVAYDFSDHAYYDRNYAPSPSYATQYQEYEVEVPVQVEATEEAGDGAEVEVEATQMMLFRQPD
jgi:hypothetical protein